MDSRRLISAIVISLLLWMVLIRFWPKGPHPTTVPAPATGTTAASAPPSATSPATGQAATTQNVTLAEDPKINDRIALGNSAPGNGYKLQAVFTNSGASLKTVHLSDFSESVKDKKPRYELIEPVKYPEPRYSLSTEQLILRAETGNKWTANLENARWFYEVKPGTEVSGQVRFWIDVLHQGRKLARVVKTYQVNKGAYPYDVGISITVENLTDRKLEAVIRQEGLVGIRKEDPRYEDRKVFAGTVASGREQVKVNSVDRASLLKLTDRSKRIGAVDEQVAWAGQSNKYFASLMAAVDDQGRLNGSAIDTVNAMTYGTNADLGEDLSTIWVTKPLALKPGAKTTLSFDLYLGPKDPNVFSQEKYAQRNYTGTFDSSMCTMQWLANVMTWLLEKLFLITHNYGLAIILIVIIVRVLMHPVSKSSQVNMMRMQRDMKRLQPKMNAIKEKFKNNREAQNKAVMELYKSEGINPAGQMLGCLPLFLQMPIWIALWTALNNSISLRFQPFFFWIKNLAGPDALMHFSAPIPIPLLSSLMGPIHELNVLPVLVMGAMLLQQMFSPQSAPTPDADPAQVKQQKIMMYLMTVFMGLIFYNAPSGLNLYILTSTALGVVESKRIRQHLEEEEKKPPEEQRKRKNSWVERFQRRMEKYAKDYEAGRQASADKKGKK